MRKHVFRLRTSIEQGRQLLVVLTYNLQDVQPWKQTTPCYQTAVYEADPSGLITTTMVEGPLQYPSEEQARQGHGAIVARLRAQDQHGTMAALPKAV
jgi:hypothetical protein